MPSFGDFSGSIVIATSALGSLGGGIGAVAEMARTALGTLAPIRVWHHPHQWTPWLRKAYFAAQSAEVLASKPAMVFYEHVDLAQIHARLPWLRSVPYVVFIHGTEVWRELPISKRLALENAALLLVNSASTLSRARMCNPWLPEPLVCWLGVDFPARPREVLASPPTAVLVGRMSARERYKGHDLVLDAWGEVRARMPAARLEIIGEGDDRERLQTRALQANLAGVDFLGRLSDEARDSRYAVARTALHVSTHEGFGLAALEALAAAVPVVGLRQTVLEELFPDGEGVAFAEAPSVSAFVRALVPLLQDAQVASALGLAGRARVGALFKRADFEGRLRAAIEPLLHARKRGA